MNEAEACTPAPLDPKRFNPEAVIPYGVTVAHVKEAMNEFLEFLGFINAQLNTKKIERLESFLMPANFSSIVGEFMGAAIPKHCKTVVRNKYHNGHPDVIPAGQYPADEIQHGPEGIEIEGSRYPSGWQGHNAEESWLMVFVFDANGPRDAGRGVPPRPFRFVKVVGGKLLRSDWQFSGRSGTSRRTITASVKRSGFDKMRRNWIYSEHGRLE
ncbi:MAG TPA: hypothetical protein VHX65_20015 [Pirellulales bacterium]|jgi:hypothetical protein|nr:hypothetical protein [Pirellulales bacterium]